LVLFFVRKTNMKTIQKIILTLLCLLLSPIFLFAQNENIDSKIGGKVGLVLTFGKPINRIGLTANAYYFYDFTQVNLEWQGYYNFTNYGPQQPSWEMRPSVGIAFGFGPKQATENPFLSPYFQQTGRRHSIAYSFHYYKNKIGTTQGTGTIALQLNQLHIIVENDVFGNTKGMDKFRTGGFAVAYQDGDFLYEIKSVLWTGETRGDARKRYKDVDHYKCRFGYTDISALPFGKLSHGVVAARVHYALPYGQVAQLGLGVDAEQVRHFWQNQVIHDMYFFPKEWTKVRNYHYPMLDTNGFPCVHADEQQVRAARWFWEVGLNGSAFY